MRAFEMNRRVFAWLNIYPATEKVSFYDKCCWVACTFIVITSESLALISSVLYIYKYADSEFVNCLYALFQVAALFGMVYMWFVGFCLKEEIDAIITQFETFHVSKEDWVLTQYLEEVNENGLWLTNFLVKHLVSAYAGTLAILAILNVIICYLIYGHINEDQLYVPYRFVLPWDQQCLLGWIGLNLFSMLAAPFYLLINFVFLSFFMGICDHQEAFFKYFNFLIRKLNKSAENAEGRLYMVKLIRFHNSARAIFMRTIDFYSLFILILLICSMIYMSCSIFLFDNVLQNFSLNIGVLVACVAVSGCNLFLYCFHGSRSTATSLAYADSLFQSEWFNLPTKLQSDIVVMIANAQRPLFYHGFGLAHLNLDTFCSMLKAVISYYLAFKTLAKK